MQIKLSHNVVAVRILAASICIGLLVQVTGCRQDPAVRRSNYLKSGLEYQKQGKFREAVIQFSNALQIDQNSSDAHYALGHTYMAMGDAQNGFRELERAVALGPSNLKARSELGLAALDMGAPAERAQEQCSAMLQLAPNNADAYNLQARIDLKEGDRAKAHEDIARALSVSPDQSSFHTTAALVALAEPKANAEDARNQLQAAISLDPYSALPHLLLAALLQQQGDAPGAIAQDQAAIRIAPFNLQARVSLGQLYLSLNDKANAESVLYQMAEDFHDNDVAVGMLQNFYVATKQLSHAEASYAALAAKYPQSVPIRVAYAQTLLSQNKFGAAETVVSALGQTSGSQPHVKMLKAVLMVHAGKTDQAVALLQQAVADTPDSTELRLLLARITAGKGDLSTAQSLYAEVLRVNRGNRDALAGLAEIAASRGDYSQLAQLADSALKAQPGLANGYYWRGVAEAGQGRYQQAEADFQAILKEDAGNATAHRALGELKLRENRTEEGIALLERSLSEDPNSLETQSALIREDVKDHHVDRAASRIRRLVALSPKNSGLYGFLASLQLSQKDFAGARDNAKLAIDLNSQNVSALEIYTRAEVALNETDGAVSLWTDRVKAHPNDAGAWTALGMLAEVQNNPAKAMDFYKKAVNIDAGQALAANNLAYLMVDRGGDLQEALSLAQRARKALPASSNTADTLAWVYYHQKEYNSARGLLEDASRSDPQNPSLQYHLGLTYLRLGDTPKAVAHLKNAESAGSKTSQDAAYALSHLSSYL